MALAVFCLLAAWAAFLGYYSLRFGLNSPPAASGDEVDYDSLGWEMSRGHGFQINTADPAFRRPYDEAAQWDPLYQLGPPRTAPVTYRPPLFPAILATGDFLAGRQFWIGRGFNALCMAGVCGLLAWVTLREKDLAVTVVVAALFVIVDVRARLYGRAMLTEALAALWVALLVLQLESLGKQPRATGALLLGVTFGLAILTRSLFVLWLPGIVLLVLWLSARSAGGIDWMRGLRTATLFAVTVFAVLTPWGIRNCQLLGGFYPLGTQGHAQLSAAFSDLAWEQQGNWPNLDDTGFFQHIDSEPSLTPLQREVAIARYSRAQAREWIANNPGRTVQLAFLKNWQEFRPRSLAEGAILLLALLGGVLGWRERRARIGWGLIAINSLAIATTWSVEGRFLVPLLFVWHDLAAQAVARLTGRKRPQE